MLAGKNIGKLVAFSHCTTSNSPSTATAPVMMSKSAVWVHMHPAYVGQPAVKENKNKRERERGRRVSIWSGDRFTIARTMWASSYIPHSFIIRVLMRWENRALIVLVASSGLQKEVSPNGSNVVLFLSYLDRTAFLLTRSDTSNQSRLHDLHTSRRFGKDWCHCIHPHLKNE